jgi:hypothetical protein
MRRIPQAILVTAGRELTHLICFLCQIIGLQIILVAKAGVETLMDTRGLVVFLSGRVDVGNLFLNSFPEQRIVVTVKGDRDRFSCFVYLSSFMRSMMH